MFSLHPPNNDHSLMLKTTHYYSPPIRDITSHEQSRMAGQNQLSNAILVPLDSTSDFVIQRASQKTSDFLLMSLSSAPSQHPVQANTPRNCLSALKAWYVVHNLKWNGSACLRYVLNGVHNLSPQSSRHPPCPPVSMKMMIQLIQHFNLTSPFNVAVAACATTAFWGQCRLGKLLPSSLLV